MEIPTGTQCHFSKGLLISASILALCIPQGSWAGLRIQKIPEKPQKDQDLLLSVQGIPDTFQDFIWYLGEEAYGGTRLFTYIPELQRPQRDGNAMMQRDIVGFPNGSMLLRHAQPKDSGTYIVVVTINPYWAMQAKTEVQVVEKHTELPVTRLPMSTGIMATIIIGSVAAVSLFIGSIAYLLVTKGCKSPSHRMETTGKPELSPSQNAGDNIYETMPSPVFLVCPLSGTGPTAPTLAPPPQPEPENHYQDLLNPDPSPYCQLVQTP
ncbi:cell adhesion molecule CEACAM19 [Hipposideros larvatus]